MVQVTLTDADFPSLTGTELDCLYSNLALAETGTQANFGAAMQSLDSLRSMMMTVSLEAAFSFGGLIDIGKSIFNRVWPTVKAIVCQIYKQNSEGGPLKNWVEAAALGIPGAIATLIIGIAMKLGLDKICDSKAPTQPA